MENSKWKLGARNVAYFDLIGSITVLLLLVVGVIMLLIKCKDQEGDICSIAGPNIWLMLALTAINTGIILWASTQLLWAVKQGVDKDIALSKAKIWRNIHVVLFILGATGAVTNRQVASGVGVIMRGIFILIVCKFIATLEHEKSTSVQTTMDFYTSAEKEKHVCCELPNV